jgi:hypothetical protein
MNRSKTTYDHDEIREWAEQRKGTPVAVKGTARGGRDVGMIRIDFPGYSGGGKLQPISWDDWFAKFDREQLAMVLQDETRSGEVSHFNRLVSRDTISEKSNPKRKGPTKGGANGGKSGAKSQTKPKARSSSRSRARAKKS